MKDWGWGGGGIRKEDGVLFGGVEKGVCGGGGDDRKSSMHIYAFPIITKC